MPNDFTRNLKPGLGVAVAKRTILRTDKDNNLEQWSDVAARVAEGNTKIIKDEYPKHAAAERLLLEKHIGRAGLLMSGRHLQHGDKTQPGRNQEVFTNCSTSSASFILFYLLMNGSGVGRAYDDDLCLVDWAQHMPELRVVLSESHKDFDPQTMEGLREAKKKYKNCQWFHVPDTREGWAAAVEKLETMTYEKKGDEFLVLDFSLVRPSGEPIKGMQNRPASGPGPLMKAFQNITTIRGLNMPAWESTMWVDHYLAECVLVGGARRSARIATKNWRDDGILDFINIKKGGFLWSANNSVTVDGDFWQLDTARKEGILDSILQTGYHDGTGEPGFINQHKLVQKDEGLEIYDDGYFAGSEKYNVTKNGAEYLKRLAMNANQKDYTQITNPCFAPGTLIHTKNGHFPIEELVGKEVEVWDGNQWTMVNNFRITGKNQKVLKIIMHDGSEVVITPNHKLILENGEKIKAKDVLPGDKLKISDSPITHGTINTKGAYIKGFLVGDGTQHNGKPILWLYDSKYQCKKRLILSLKEVEVDEGLRSDCIQEPRFDQNADNRKVMQGLSARKSLIDWTKKYKQNLPPEVFAWDLESKLEFIAGAMDADGTASDTQNGFLYQISSIHRSWLRDFQTLLKTVGVNSRLSIMKRPGKKDFHDGYGKYKSKECWRLTLNQNPSIALSKQVGFERLTSFADKTTAYKIRPRFNKIKKIESVGIEERVYCCTVPITHQLTLSVGFYSGQCGEVALHVLGGYCVIADVVPYYAKDDDSAEESFRVATRALMRTNLLDSLYDKEVTRTNRIGVGMTGIYEYAWNRFGFGFKDLIDEEESKEFWMMLSRFKRAVEEEAQEYAEFLGVNIPHTNTTIKPAGCQRKDTLISTKSGILSLNEIGDVAGDTWQNHKLQVYTDEGEKKSKKFFINGHVKTKKITLTSGIELESTPGHKYKILRDGEVFWKEASEIISGDFLPYSVGEYSGGDYQELESIKFKKRKYAHRQINIKQPSKLNEDIAWLIGLYFGDGSNHERAIRIHGNKKEYQQLKDAKNIVQKHFGISSKINIPNRPGNRIVMSINSNQIIPFLEKNGLKKQKSSNIEIPTIIRMSPKSVIESFIEGYYAADGCDKNPSGLTSCTSSEKFARQLVVVLRAIGRDAKMRLMPPTKTSKGDSMRYWVSERQGRLAKERCIQKWLRQAWSSLDKLGMDSYSVDKVVKIEDSSCNTFDLEVEDNHTYYANSYISHNTTSKLFGLAEGAHLPAMKEYMRWVQFRHDDPIVQEYKDKGYPTKKLTTYKDATIVGFPTQPEICKLGMGDKLVTAGEATMEEQYQWLRLLEKYWIQGVDSSGKKLTTNTGNQVSYTLKYKPNRVDFDTYKQAIIENQPTIRCCSIMPQIDKTAYEYQPEEPVSADKFAEVVAGITDDMVEDIDLEHLECESGACPI